MVIAFADGERHEDEFAYQVAQYRSQLKTGADLDPGIGRDEQQGIRDVDPWTEHIPYGGVGKIQKEQGNLIKNMRNDIEDIRDMTGIEVPDNKPTPPPEMTPDETEQLEQIPGRRFTSNQLRQLAAGGDKPKPPLPIIPSDRGLYPPTLVPSMYNPWLPPKKPGEKLG